MILSSIVRLSVEIWGGRHPGKTPWLHSFRPTGSLLLLSGYAKTQLARDRLRSGRTSTLGIPNIVTVSLCVGLPGHPAFPTRIETVQSIQFPTPNETVQIREQRGYQRRASKRGNVRGSRMRNRNRLLTLQDLRHDILKRSRRALTGNHTTRPRATAATGLDPAPRRNLTFTPPAMA